MAEPKDWLFLFPIITAALLYISIFYNVPIMHVILDIPDYPIVPTVEGDVFPFGGGIIDEIEFYIPLVEWFNPTYADYLSNIQSGLMWFGIVFAIFFGLDALLLVINGIRVKTGSKALKKARRKWLWGGITKIISQIIVIIVMITVVPDIVADYTHDLAFLSFTMGLGMLLVMVAGGILIFAYILAKIAG